MLGVEQDLFHRTILDDAAQVHHDDAVGDVPREPEVVEEAQQRCQDLATLSMRQDTDHPLPLVVEAVDADPHRGEIVSATVSTLINNTGTISTVRGDVGVVVGPVAEVAYAVLASWTEDAAEDPRDRVLAEMAAIGSAIRSLVGA